ncbi:MAG TPA: hypothetical protein DGC94_10620 [Prolixibacteraceae bacterium]|nr:hypothetical protein [Prolixibacteraceae bacterium]
MLFHSPDVATQHYFKYRKAQCYKQLKDFSRALEELQSIYFNNSSDSLYMRVCYEQSLCLYLNGEAPKALWKIDEYIHRSKDSTSFQYFMPIKLLCYNETQQWNEAKGCFVQFIKAQTFSQEKEKELTDSIEWLYTRKNLPRMKSADRAETWSRFIPGAGQIYAGHTGEGITNFLINASILTFAGIQAINHYYITGYLMGLGFFNKTYHGGMKRAVTLAQERNKEEMIRFNSKINQMIRESCIAE